MSHIEFVMYCELRSRWWILGQKGGLARCAFKRCRPAGIASRGWGNEQVEFMPLPKVWIYTQMTFHKVWLVFSSGAGGIIIGCNRQLDSLHSAKLDRVECDKLLHLKRCYDIVSHNKLILAKRRKTWVGHQPGSILWDHTIICWYFKWCFARSWETVKLQWTL